MRAFRAFCGAILASASVAVATILSFWAAGGLHLRDPVEELAVLVWPIFLTVGILGAALVGALTTLARSVQAGALAGAAAFASVPLLIMIGASVSGAPLLRLVGLAVNAIACAVIGALAGGTGAAVRALELRRAAADVSALGGLVRWIGAVFLTTIILVALGWCSRVAKDAAYPDPIPHSMREFFPRVDVEEGTIRGLDIMRRRGAFDDSHMAWVGTLSALESLTLSHTAVSDEGIGHLVGVIGLRELLLDYTQVTDLALKYLPGMKELRRLSLRGTGVSDAGMASLVPLARLEFLDLAETRVGDEGLKFIGALDRLEYVDVTRTQVTPNGIRGLQNALPRTRIAYDATPQ